MENVSFAEAVEMVANRFSIPVEYEKTATHGDRPYGRKALFDLHELACNFFVENFNASDPDGEKIRRYWTEEREFSLDVAKENCIGFGGDRGKFLMSRMLAAKFSPAAIRASGIFYHRENDPDLSNGILRFNSRLTIPIRDVQGRVVGFSARFIDGISRPGDFPDAKYINSPDTEIFHKGSLLFGLHRARQYLEPNGVFWMVEGQFDAMRCWKNGINTAIAPQGTAITDFQLNAMRRHTVHLNCMLDGDSAGLKAAERMLPMAIASGLDVKFFILPDGNDPDSYFRENFSDKFRSLQQGAMTQIQFLVNRFLPNKDSVTAQEKANSMARIYEVIAMAESSVARESYLAELSVAANFDRSAISQDFRSFTTKRKFSPVPQPEVHSEHKNSDKKLSSAEGQLLAVVLVDDKIAIALSHIMEQPFLQNLHSDEGKILLKVLNEVRNYSWEGISTLDDRKLFSDVERNVAYAVVADLDERCDRIDISDMCVKKLHYNFVRGEIEKTNEQFRKISLDESDAIRTLQKHRLYLRGELRHPPQVFWS
jgi:DNA primase